MGGRAPAASILAVCWLFDSPTICGRSLPGILGSQCLAGDAGQKSRLNAGYRRMSEYSDNVKRFGRHDDDRLKCARRRVYSPIRIDECSQSSRLTTKDVATIDIIAIYAAMAGHNMIKVRSYGGSLGFRRPLIILPMVTLLSRCVHCNDSSRAIDVPSSVA